MNVKAFREFESLPFRFFWRSGRVVEGARLENVYTLTGIEGSNPSSSVLYFQQKEVKINIMNDKMKAFLKFEWLITPIIIQVIFWIGVVSCVLGGLSMMIFIREPESIWVGLFTIILGPIAVRVVCELHLLIFKFYDAIVALKK